MTWKRGKVLLKSVKASIPTYTGYDRKKRKEDDLALRDKLSSHIKNARGVMTNILEEVNSKEDKNTNEIIKKIMDELDLFYNDITLSEKWHKEKHFRSSRWTDKKTVLNVMEFDLSMIEAMDNVKVSCKKLYFKIINNEEIQLNTELKKIKQFVTVARSDFNERNDFIGRLR